VSSGQIEQEKVSELQEEENSFGSLLREKMLNEYRKPFQLLRNEDEDLSAPIVRWQDVDWSSLYLPEPRVWNSGLLFKDRDDRVFESYS
jgi:hypothetical protein